MSLKRAFDLCAASTGLVLLAPVLTMIALWIKLDSRGPVFFRQQRVGQFGRLFDIHKFRTMTVRQQQGALQITVGDDARITRSGAFLRKYKLDELPQLIDVVRGCMSIVGPRPEVPRYMAYYPEEARRRILSVKPGITDRASLEFRDENAMLAGAADPEQVYIERILPIKQAYYLQYVQQQSFWFDIKIILQTIYLVFMRNRSASTILHAPKK